MTPSEAAFGTKPKVLGLGVKQKEKVVESSEELNEETNEEDDRDLGPSVPKKRKLQDTISKTIDEKDGY